MDTSLLLIGAIVLFILVVMFVVVYGGPSTKPIAVPILQAVNKDCGCPRKDRCEEDCPIKKRKERKEHKKGCGCDPCRKKKYPREEDSELLYDDMDGFQNSMRDSAPAPFTIGTPA